MNGLKINIPMEVTNTNIPKMYEHPLLSKGSLMLIDTSRIPIAPLTFPSTLPNLAKDMAMSILATTEANVTPAFTAGANVGGVASSIERTSKGGVHAIISKVNDTTSTNYVIPLYNALKTFINNNPSHAFYVSIWNRITRVGGASHSSSFYMQNGSNYFFSFQPTILPNVQPYKIGSFQSSSEFYTSLGSKFGSIGFVGKFGNPTAANASCAAFLGAGGVYPSLHTAPSNIFYQFYIEDLTISGRSYKEVERLDYSLYQEAFAVGGKFYNDTFTDPSTLP